MRQILVDRARSKQAAKHGAGAEHIDITKIDVAIDSDDETLLLVNEALEQLAGTDAEAAEFVRLRFFVGLAVEEIAQILGLSERSARRLWVFSMSPSVANLRLAKRPSGRPQAEHGPRSA